MWVNFPLILIGVLLNAAAQLFLKKGMNTIGQLTLNAHSLIQSIPAMIKNIYLWGGMGCYALSILLWLVVLSRVQVSLAYPFQAIGYIVAAVVAYYMLGESLSTAKIIGIVVISIGIIIISRG